jgi:hypothetical protein
MLRRLQIWRRRLLRLLDETVQEHHRVVSTVNRTLAMPVAMRDLTSHKPGSSLRMSGMPIGQPNRAVLMSNPTSR